MSPIFELYTDTLTRPSLAELVFFKVLLVFVALAAVLELVVLRWLAFPPAGLLELASARKVESMPLLFVKVGKLGEAGSRNASSIEMQFPRRNFTLKSFSPACSIM